MTVTAAERRRADRRFFTGLARAFGAAIIFSLPLLMTMEMWWLGFYMSRLRLAAFMVLMYPLLLALDRFSGFKKTSTWLEDAVDALVAYGVGTVSSAVLLFILGVIDAGMLPGEIIGKIALQSVPASFGAVLAASQLGGEGTSSTSADDGITEAVRDSYLVTLLFMLAGAVFMAFNVAPTEEMIVLAFKMSPARTLAAVVLSLLLMHGFVYAVEFRGTPQTPADVPGWSLFMRYTLVGYAISLLVSAYVLWTFGRFEEGRLLVLLTESIVLAVPSSIGAAAARLIL